MERREWGGEGKVDASKEVKGAAAERKERKERGVGNEIDFISAPRAIASTEICDDHLRAIERGWPITTVS